MSANQWARAAEAGAVAAEQLLDTLREAGAPFLNFASVLLPSLDGDKLALSHADDATGPTAWRVIAYGDIRRLARAFERIRS